MKFAPPPFHFITGRAPPPHMEVLSAQNLPYFTFFPIFPSGGGLRWVRWNLKIIFRYTAPPGPIANFLYQIGTFIKEIIKANLITFALFILAEITFICIIAISRRKEGGGEAFFGILVIYTYNFLPLDFFLPPATHILGSLSNKKRSKYTNDIEDLFNLPLSYNPSVRLQMQLLS